MSGWRAGESLDSERGGTSTRRYADEQPRRMAPSIFLKGPAERCELNGESWTSRQLVECARIKYYSTRRRRAMQWPESDCYATSKMDMISRLLEGCWLGQEVRGVSSDRFLFTATRTQQASPVLLVGFVRKKLKKANRTWVAFEPVLRFAFFWYWSLALLVQHELCSLLRTRRECLARSHVYPGRRGPAQSALKAKKTSRRWMFVRPQSNSWPVCVLRLFVHVFAYARQLNKLATVAPLTMGVHLFPLARTTKPRRQRSRILQAPALLLAVCGCP